MPGALAPGGGGLPATPANALRLRSTLHLFQPHQANQASGPQSMARPKSTPCLHAVKCSKQILQEMLSSHHMTSEMAASAALVQDAMVPAPIIVYATLTLLSNLMLSRTCTSPAGYRLAGRQKRCRGHCTACASGGKHTLNVQEAYFGCSEWILRDSDHLAEAEKPQKGVGAVKVPGWQRAALGAQALPRLADWHPAHCLTSLHCVSFMRLPLLTCSPEH